jgi:hypothetical protein
MIRISLANYAPRLELALPGNEVIFKSDGNGVGTTVPQSDGNGVGTTVPQSQVDS